MGISFLQKLQHRWDMGLRICVGLDLTQLPLHLQDRPGGRGEGLFEFAAAIVQKTNDLVCAYKPNLGFYGRGMEGTLRRIVDLIHTIDPTIPVIGDGKRGDVGSTNEAYADDLFRYYDFDAVTLNPYLGPPLATAKTPGNFLAEEFKNRGLIFLARTFNPEAAIIQDRQVWVSAQELTLDLLRGPLPSRIEMVEWKWQPCGDGGYLIPLYQFIAMYYARLGVHCGLVAGATVPEELGIIRRQVGDDTFLLVPGIGKQGGNLSLSVGLGKNSRNNGFIINSSSAITNASAGEDFADMARARTLELHQQIRALLEAA